MSNVILNDKVVSIHRPLLNTEREWVRCWLLNNGAKYDYRSKSVIINNNVLPHEDVIVKMDLECSEDPNMRSIYKLRLLRAAYSIWLQDHETAYLEDFKNSFTHVPSSTDYAYKFILALTGSVSELDVAVIKHFMWQVRRKVYGYEVDYHLMPILYGKGKSGKSTAVARLIGIMEKMSVGLNLSDLADNRRYYEYARKYIGVLNEINQGSRTEIEAVKNLITSTDLDWRVLNTHKTESGVNRCTFIGTSNKPIDAIIRDTTGIRRFYQINCADNIDHNGINSIDYIEMWRSIDESKPTPILNFMEQLESHQEVLTPMDPVDEWLNCQEVIGADWHDWVSATEIYNEFSKNAYSKHVSGQAFWSRINEIIAPDRIHRTNKGVRYNIKIKSGFVR